MDPENGDRPGSNLASIDRRRVLALVGAGALPGVAGCTGGGDGDGSGGDDEGGAGTTTTSEEDGETTGDGSTETTTTSAGDDETTSDGGTETTTTGEGDDDCPSTGTDGDLQDPGVANGTVVKQAIEELEVVAIESSLETTDDGDEIFRVAVTFRNNGPEETNARDYTTDLTVYDESCNELDIRGVVQSGLGGMEPGETATIFVNPNAPQLDHTKIAGYELTVDCSGPFADGKFCPESSE